MSRRAYVPQSFYMIKNIVHLGEIIEVKNLENADLIIVCSGVEKNGQIFGISKSIFLYKLYPINLKLYTFVSDRN